MRFITEEEAKRQLGPYHSAFAESLESAFDSWRSSAAPVLPFFRKRTQANFIQDAAETVLRSKLGGLPNIVLSPPRRNRFWVYLKESDLLVRVKKLDENFTTSNYPTPTARLFDTQQALPGVPEAQRVTLGYRLDTAGTKMHGVWVTLLVGSQPLWKYAIETTSGVTSISPDEQAPMPVTAELKLRSSTQRPDKEESK